MCPHQSFHFSREVDDSNNERSACQATQVQASAPPATSTAADLNVQSSDQNVAAQNPVSVGVTTPLTSTVDKPDAASSTAEPRVLHAGVKRKYKKATKHEYKTYSDR